MLVSIGLIFIVGLLLGSLFRKIKLPSLIGYLITGIILGPFVLNIIDDSILLIGPDLRQIALVIILTRAGLSLDLNDLKKIGRPGLLLCFLPAIFEISATIIVAPLLLNISYLDAALLGSVIASASPAVVVPRMTKLIDEKVGTNKLIPQMVLAGDSVDDVFNIVIFTMLISFQTGNNSSIGLQLLSIPSSVVLGILLGLVSGYLVSLLFNKIKMNTTIQVIIVLSVGFLFIALENMLVDIVSISGLLGVMVNGIILLKKSPNIARNMSNMLSKIWIGAEVMLFVLIGMVVNINFASNYLWQSIILLIIVLSIRGLGILISLIGTNLNRKEKLFTVITGIPKATVQAAIGGIPLMLGLPSGELILSVAVITILFTAPLGAFLIDVSYPRLLEVNSEVS